MPEIWCGWCPRPIQAKYAVRYVRPGPVSKTEHRTCGVHLSRVIEFATAPGGIVEVEVLR